MAMRLVALLDVSFDVDRSLGSASAERQGQAAIGCAADSGFVVIGVVVDTAANSFACRTIDRFAGALRRLQRHAARRKGIAVDVGHIVVELLASDGVLKLGDCVGAGGVGDLDRITTTVGIRSVRGAPAATRRDSLHAAHGIGDGPEIDGVATVVRDAGSSGTAERSKSKQRHGRGSHSCIHDGM